MFFEYINRLLIYLQLLTLNTHFDIQKMLPSLALISRRTKYYIVV